jgi:hypothetical protein
MALSRQEILRQLEARLLSLRPHNGYPVEAIEANLAIVRAMRSPLSYARWLANTPRCAPELLLEMNELLEEWDGPIHQLLLRMERRHSPGLIRPLVRRLANLGRGRECFTILDIGAGAMEVERQLIGQLHCISRGTRLRIAAVEPSARARKCAVENLRSLGDAVAVRQVGLGELAEAMQCTDDAARARHRVWLCEGTSGDFPEGLGRLADVAFHCFVRHHLTAEQRERVDVICGISAHRRIEYDGYRHWAHPVFMSTFCWHQPAFLAAAMFSYLRYPTIAEAQTRGQKVCRFANGSYLAESSCA